jgi:phage-related protein
MVESVANVEAVAPKSVVWVGSSKENLRAFPDPVQKSVGYGLWFAQIGSKHPNAKVLRGFGGAGVVEIIEDWEGNTYRAVYTVKFGDFVYVLHCFQKKSKRGTQTPQADMALVRSRLRLAEADYRARKEAK